MRSRNPYLSPIVLSGVLFAWSSFLLQAQQPQTTEAPKPQSSSPPAASSTDSTSARAPKPADTAKDSNAPKAASLTPTARLAAAHTVYIKRMGGSDIPVNSISEGIKGWGRYVLVGAPEKADLLLEVESPENTSGLTLATSERTAKSTGEPDRSSSTTLSRQTVSSEVKLTVRDAKSGMVLWLAVEQAKSSVRRVNRENSLVEAGERRFVRFHDRVEPPARVVP
jgi:hypothetical protein